MKTRILLLMLLGGCSTRCDTEIKVSSIDRTKDPVCQMWVNKVPDAIKAEFDYTDFYFCAQECKDEFLKNPTKYVTKCKCRDCKCSHCKRTHEPCDCTR